jgi:hypothetical protein
MSIEKQNGCIDSIVNALTRTCEVRSRKAAQYDDPRSVKAEASLKRLAMTAAESGQDFWHKLQPYYDDPDSKNWQDALFLATKEIGFKNHSKSLPFFMTRLIRHLAAPTSA